ncbi:hypothetical protein [Mesorhizobium sp. B2-1-5]|uniref:hypothetical protein n=1 Tax=Mesorhizobium sp. B2-1-5 TaxID=2589969 RepID=UPI0015E28B1E|nr:hypothetical protein [Mesorhizobium sp. B2-1-5]
MEDDGSEREDRGMRLLARRLAKEVGISERQARDLIKLIGPDWNSLLREARFLRDRN